MKGIGRKDKQPSQSSSQSKVQVEGKGKGRLYVTWNKDMDTLLAAVLSEQINQGNKADGDWKSQAYQAAVDELKATLNLNLTRDNVKNRIKIWKKHYAVITDITNQSGFEWDEERKMVPITAKNRGIWLDYVKSHPDARGYQNKVIDNWDDIVMLCAKDRATGAGARNIEDTFEEIGGEDENEVELLEEDGSTRSHSSRVPSSSTAKQSSPRPKKRTRKDTIAEAINRMATSLEEYMVSRTKETQSIEEIDYYNEVSKVEGLTENEVFAVVQRFMAGNISEFKLLKSLPDDKKKGWIRVLLGRPST